MLDDPQNYNMSINKTKTDSSSAMLETTFWKVYTDTIEIPATPINTTISSDEIKDISEFYNTDLTGIEAAGVLDIYGKNFYHYNGIFNFYYMYRYSTVDYSDISIFDIGWNNLFSTIFPYSSISL